MLAAQSCLTLCDLMDSNPSGSSVHGILQERILEWVAIPFQIKHEHKSTYSPILSVQMPNQMFSRDIVTGFTWKMGAWWSEFEELSFLLFSR